MFNIYCCIPNLIAQIHHWIITELTVGGSSRSSASKTELMTDSGHNHSPNAACCVSVARIVARSVCIYDDWVLSRKSREKTSDSF